MNSGISGVRSTDILMRGRLKQLFRVGLVAMITGVLLFLVARPAPAALIYGDFTGQTFYSFSAGHGASKARQRVSGRFIIDLDKVPVNRCRGNDNCYYGTSKEKGDSSWLTFYLSVDGRQYKTTLGGGWNYSSAWVRDSYKSYGGGRKGNYDAVRLWTSSRSEGGDKGGKFRRYVAAGLNLRGGSDWLSSASLADLVSLDDPMAWWKSKGRLGVGYYRDMSYRYGAGLKNHGLMRGVTSSVGFTIDSLKIGRLPSGGGAGAMAVPEPDGLALLLSGLAGIAFWRRRMGQSVKGRMPS